MSKQSNQKEIVFQYNGENFRYVSNIWIRENGMTVSSREAQILTAAYIEQYGPLPQPPKRRGRKKRYY